MLWRTPIALSTAALLSLAPGVSGAGTRNPSLCASRPDQPDSTAEILRIEKQWSQAYWTGHTAYLECLYAPDFVSVSSNGKMHDGAHDISGSLRYVGKSYTPSGKLETEVLMHPGYAIATSIKPHAVHGLRVTDIYAYDGHHWHAIFSQDTKY